MTRRGRLLLQAPSTCTLRKMQSCICKSKVKRVSVRRIKHQLTQYVKMECWIELERWSSISSSLGIWRWDFTCFCYWCGPSHPSHREQPSRQSKWMSKRFASTGPWLGPHIVGPYPLPCIEQKQILSSHPAIFYRGPQLTRILWLLNAAHSPAANQSTVNFSFRDQK